MKVTLTKYQMEIAQGRKQYPKKILHYNTEAVAQRVHTVGLMFHKFGKFEAVNPEQCYQVAKLLKDSYSYLCFGDIQTMMNLSAKGYLPEIQRINIENILTIVEPFKQMVEEWIWLLVDAAKIDRKEKRA